MDDFNCRDLEKNLKQLLTRSTDANRAYICSIFQTLKLSKFMPFGMFEIALQWNPNYLYLSLHTLLKSHKHSGGGAFEIILLPGTRRCQSPGEP